MKCDARKVLVLVAAMCALVVGRSHGQIPSDMQVLGISERVVQVQESQYGRLLHAEFRKVVIESMDPSCLESRPSASNESELDKLLGEMFREYATNSLNTVNQAFDTQKYNAALDKLLSQAERASAATLSKDPLVGKYISLGSRFANANLAEMLHEGLYRVARINGGSSLKRGWCAACTGRLDLFELLDATKNDQSAEKYYLQHHTPMLRRWRDIEEASAEASNVSFNVQKSFLPFGQQRLLGEKFADQLKDVCVQKSARERPAR